MNLYQLILQVCNLLFLAVWKDDDDSNEKNIEILVVLLMKPVGGTTQPGELASHALFKKN